MRTQTAQCLTVGLLAAALGCSDTTSPAGPGRNNVSVLLTDNPFPFDQVSRADLFLVRIEVGTDSGSTGGACTGATIIAEPNQTYDLLSLQRGVTANLGSHDLPPGLYGAVCVTINTDLSSLTLKDGRVLRGNTTPVIDWSGSGERVIKALIWSPVPVTDTSGTFLIHFDVGNSFISLSEVYPPRTDSGYAFVPAITVADPAATGALSGTVLYGGAGGAPLLGASVRAMVGDTTMSPDTWFSAGTGTTDSSGHFKLAFLIPGAYYGTVPGRSYILEVNPPSTLSRTVVRKFGVAVTAGTETAIGTVTLN